MARSRATSAAATATGPSMSTGVRRAAAPSTTPAAMARSAPPSAASNSFGCRAVLRVRCSASRTAAHRTIHALSSYRPPACRTGGSIAGASAPVVAEITATAAASCPGPPAASTSRSVPLSAADSASR